MDRASDSGSEGWGFESLPVYQIKKRIPKGYPLLYFALRAGKDSNHLNVTVRWTVAGDGLTEPNLYFLSLGAKENANESLPVYLFI